MVSLLNDDCVMRMNKSMKIIIGVIGCVIVVAGLYYGVLAWSFSEGDAGSGNIRTLEFFEEWRGGVAPDVLETDILFDGMEIRAKERKGLKVSENVIIIEQAGAYVVSGRSDDGMIVIDYAGEDEVALIFNGLHLESKVGPAVYIKRSGDATIFLVENTANIVSDAERYSAEFAEEVTGAIYSKSDLYIQGEGSLTVYGNHNDALVSKDDLTIMDAVLMVYAVDDGIRGKDSVEIEGADIYIAAKDDGLKSDNETDEGRANIRISDAVLNISAGDDAITAKGRVAIESGEITVLSSYEGIEARQLYIYDGSVEVHSYGDSLNAIKVKEKFLEGHAKHEAQEGVGVHIHGGNIALFSEEDGIDSNGQISMSGGILTLYSGASEGSGEIIDVNGKFIVAGGEVRGFGPRKGLAPHRDSTQYSMKIDLSSIQSAGTVVSIVDAETEESFLRFTSEKAFQSIVFSSPDLRDGGTYALYLDDAVHTTVTLIAVTTLVTADGEVKKFGR